MIFYKIMRYFFFLFLTMCSLLFLLKNYVKPIPQLTSFYEQTEENFHRYIGIKQDDFKTNFTEKNLDHFFKDTIEQNQQFLNDFRLQSALNETIRYKFDDISYLIQEYFQVNPYFKDIIISRAKTALYKHNNFYQKSTLQFVYHVTNYIEIFKLQIVYDQKLLNDLIQKYDKPIIINYNKKTYSSPIVEEKFVTLFQKYVSVHTNDVIIKISHKQMAHFFVDTNMFTEPITMMEIVNQSETFNVLKLLYYLILPLIWLLVLILDKCILKYLLYQKKSVDYKKKFYPYYEKSAENSDVDESLNWLDRFIKMETINEIETISNKKQKNSNENDTNK